MATVTLDEHTRRMLEQAEKMRGALVWAALALSSLESDDAAQNALRAAYEYDLLKEVQGVISGESK